MCCWVCDGGMSVIGYCPSTRILSKDEMLDFGIDGVNPFISFCLFIGISSTNVVLVLGTSEYQVNWMHVIGNCYKKVVSGY